MKIIVTAMIAALAAVTPIKQEKWYSGDEHCPVPKDDGTYSAPYNPLDSPHEYPTFPGADKPGWACSYKRSDGVIIQYGDSLTPQQQWIRLWGGSSNSLND